MTTTMLETAIGAVARNGKLTTVVRLGTRLEQPHIEPAETPEQVTAALLKLKHQLRSTYPCDPVAFLESSPVAGHAVTLIGQHDVHSVDQIVEGTGPATTCAPGGAEYANRWSELLHTFLDDMTAGKIFVPPHAEFEAQLTTFVRGERNGKIHYPSALDVSEKLGRYPALTVAMILAYIAAPPPGAQHTAIKPHDPYEDI